MYLTISFWTCSFERCVFADHCAFADLIPFLHFITSRFTQLYTFWCTYIANESFLSPRNRFSISKADIAFCLCDHNLRQWASVSLKLIWSKKLSGTVSVLLLRRRVKNWGGLTASNSLSFSKAISFPTYLKTQRAVACKFYTDSENVHFKGYASRYF